MQFVDVRTRILQTVMDVRTDATVRIVPVVVRRAPAAALMARPMLNAAPAIHTVKLPFCFRHFTLLAKSQLHYHCGESCLLIQAALMCDSLLLDSSPVIQPRRAVYQADDS